MNGPEVNTLSPEGYVLWLAGFHAREGRKLAEQARSNVPMTGDMLGAVLDNLAAIAERVSTGERE